MIYLRITAGENSTLKDQFDVVVWKEGIHRITMGSLDGSLSIRRRCIERNHLHKGKTLKKE